MSKHNRHHGHRHGSQNRYHTEKIKKIRDIEYNPKFELDDYNIKPVPKFHTSEECLKFIQNFEDVTAKLVDYRIVTDYDELTNVILNGIDDIENSNIQDDKLLDSIRNELPIEYNVILDKIDKKKDVYIPKNSNFKERLLNTLHYLFYHMRSGIYCRIENNKVKQFIVFVNKEYRNNWSQYLTFEGDDGKLVDINKYYEMKRKYYRRENILPIDQWHANAHMFDNEPSPNLFGMHLIASIVDMLDYNCNVNKLKNTSFFINKRDYPQLRADLTEPYAFLFPKKTVLPQEYLDKGFLPIHSYFVSEKFLDIPTVSTDDWEVSTGLIPLSDRPSDKYSNINYDKYKHIKWSQKKSVAFFRGSGTGGADVETNQRFKLAKISYEYNNNSVEPKENSILDGGVVSWNVRDKKVSSDSPVTFTRHKEIGFPRAGFVSMSQQMTYKMIIYIDGHAAAARYLFLMKMKVLILRVESIRPETSELWFFDLLKNGEDHVLIDSNMNNLLETIQYYVDHDDEAKRIAKNAYKKYRTLLSKTNILKYHAYCVNSF